MSQILAEDIQLFFLQTYTRLLIAEDDMITRRVLETALTKQGYGVVVTCNGDEAWEALQQEDAPPLAILDWMMPEIDGVEVCRRVRQTAQSCPI